MGALAYVIVFSWLAGITAFIGSLLSRFERVTETEIKRELLHGVVAFGGGILVAAVAFSLAPEAVRVLPTGAMVVTFCLGGLTFCMLDAWLSKRVGSKAQLMAMLMDFVPEAIALGALFGHDRDAALLLALFIAAQNLPEGFNSYRELAPDDKGGKSALAAFFWISFLGPVAATAGYLFLQNQPSITAGIMSFAAGSILYLIFQDIAPQSTMRRHWMPPLGAVLGFMLGMVGHQMLG